MTYREAYVPEGSAKNSTTGSDVTVHERSLLDPAPAAVDSLHLKGPVTIRQPAHHVRSAASHRCTAHTRDETPPGVPVGDVRHS